MKDSLKSLYDLHLTRDSGPNRPSFLVKSGGLTHSIFSTTFCSLNISIKYPLFHLSLSDFKFSLRSLRCSYNIQNFLEFLGSVSAIVQFSMCCQSDVDSKFELQTPDVALSLQRTSLFRVKDLCFQMFFLGVVAFCWPFLLHGLLDFPFHIFGDHQLQIPFSITVTDLLYLSGFVS